MTERQISDGLCAYLRKEGLSFIRARTDKKSGIQEGWPDISVAHCGKIWLCELKTATGKLSAKQVECHAKLQRNGTPVTVARSVEQAISAVQSWLGVENEAGGLPGPKEGQVCEHSGAKLDQVSGKPEPRPETTVSTQKETESEPAPLPCFIADFGGKPCVFLPTPCASHPNNCRLLRTATQYDLLHIPRK